MLELLFKICFLCQSISSSNLTDFLKSNHRHLSLRHKPFEEHVDIMKRTLSDFDDDDKTANAITVTIGNQNNIIDVLTKLLIMVLIFAGGVVLIAIIISLIFVCINCSRPSRIHKQIPIEYLDSSEMISDVDDTSTSVVSPQRSAFE